MLTSQVENMKKFKSHMDEAAPKVDPDKYAAHMARNKKPKKMTSTQKSVSDIAKKAEKMAMKTEGVKGALGGALGGGAAGAAAGYKYMGKPGAVVGGLGGALIGGSFGSGAEDGYKFARRPKKKKVQEGSCGSSTRKKNIREYSDEELASHANKVIADKKKAAIGKDEVAKPTDREDRAIAHLRKRRPGSDLTKDKEER